MNTELFIARRYLLSRHRKFLSFSTVIGIGGVFIGVAALLITLSMMNGFQNELRRRILGGTPHIIVRKYFNEPIREYQTLAAKLEDYRFIEAAAPFVYQKSVIKYKQQLDGVVIKGVDDKLEQNITEIGQKMIDGVFRLRGGCVIGVELAHSLGVNVGDSLVVALPFGDQLGLIPRAKRVVVNGIFDLGYYDYNATLIYMDLKDVQALFDMGESINGIAVKIGDIYRAPQYARRIESDLGYPYRAQDWIESNRSVFAALRIEKIITFIVLILIIIVAGFNIVGTLINMVKKKTKEIGIMRSFGFTARQIMKVFVYHGTIIGLIGTALGLGFAYFACVVLDRYQVSLPGDIYFIETLPVEMDLNDFLLTALAAILISFLATIYPARRATQLTAVEALRNE
ncbi:ABC transporter permease [candidate division WOR-3 bacterium]|nr:ABC transporter permease [candidate division WOR-3 bacterium]